jgi:nucleoside-diphosphate-sugar epimerase
MGEHIAAAISVRKISQLIYLSSDAIFGQVLDKIDEGTSASPVDLYGVMHWSRELMFRELANKSNIPFCVLRPSAIFGPGDTHNSYGPNRFVRSSLREGTIRLFGLGEELRDHVFIDDVVRVAKLAIYHGSSGTLNVVSGQTISFGDLATMIAELGGGTTRIESTPRLGAITHRSFDASAISRSFVRFQPTPLKVGLSKTIDSFSRE